MNYYNEFDTKTAAWLRELINQGLIPKGDVDTRSITEVKPHELTGYTQCHFFAGIGGWSLALQLAGWSADTPVWTGSCPCQPFSAAGKGLGAADERHLWPAFFNLIKECRPQYVFGEQVASAIGHGWLDGISSDLGEEGYACGSALLGAHSVGSPHIRQRLYWLAVASDNGAGGDARKAGGLQGESMDARAESLRQTHGETGASGADSRSASGHWDACDIIDCLDGKSRRVEPGTFPLVNGLPKGMVYSSDPSTPINPQETAEARKMRLKGYGNAIVPQVAAEFISAFAEETKIFTKSLDV